MQKCKISQKYFLFPPSQNRKMHNMHIYSAYFMHKYNNKQQIIVNYANFIHIFLVFSYIYCNFATANV